MTNISELPPSKLGTQEYWQNVYSRELENPDQDVGPGWFGAQATNRVVNWVEKNFEDQKVKILDIGCGGGEVLIELFERGFTDLIGTDYCSSAIEVCHENLKKSSFPEDSILFLNHDIVTQSLVVSKDSNKIQVVSDDKADENFGAKFTVCLDKGTFDAISLSPVDAAGQRGQYIKKLLSMMAEDSFFVIVSCNWTTDELKEHFKEMSFVEELKGRSFSFGGQTGQDVSTCVFKLK